MPAKAILPQKKPIPGRLIRSGKRKGQFQPAESVLKAAEALAEAKTLFVRLLWLEGTLAAACKAASLTPDTVKKWQDQDAEFKAAVETVRKKHDVLRFYRRFGTEYEATRHARTSVARHKQWLDTDPEYAEAFIQAKKDAMDIAETALRERGVYGLEKPVFYKGIRVATVNEKDTTALIFHLKGRRRDVYGDKTEVSGAGGGPIQLQLVERLQAGRQRVAALIEAKATPEALDGEVLKD